MNEEWGGEERRKSVRDHDVLTRIDANLSNFLNRFEVHINEDANQFKELKEEVKSNQKYILLGIGGICVIAFFIKLVLK